MNEFEHQVQRIARQFPYPPTPAVRWPGRARTAPAPLRLTRALAALVVLLAVVMISPLRASVLEWLQIGVIRIFVGETPAPAPTLASLLDLYGQTTFDDAQQLAGFRLRTPADFGPPDEVYRQNADGSAVILVWLAKEGRPAISLFEFGENSGNIVYGKILSFQVDTQVHGQTAVWVDFPHTLQYERGGSVITRQTFLVGSHVLIWYEDGVTYRLESNLTMAEAVAIAESLR